MTAPDRPKGTRGTASNTEKDPDAWVTGDEPMTDAQASYLQTLCEEVWGAVRSEFDQGGRLEEDRRTAQARPAPHPILRLF